MGQRGPKPKPARAGGSGRVARGRPDRPAELTGEAASEWDRVAVSLEAAGLLAAVDRGILAAYCLAVADMLAARAEILSAGRWIREPVQTSRGEKIGERVREHPAVKLLDKASGRVLKLAAALGLSPGSRAGLETGPTPAAAGNRFIDLAATMAANRARGAG